MASTLTAMLWPALNGALETKRLPSTSTSVRNEPMLRRLSCEPMVRPWPPLEDETEVLRAGSWISASAMFGISTWLIASVVTAVTGVGASTPLATREPVTMTRSVGSLSTSGYAGWTVSGATAAGAVTS